MNPTTEALAINFRITTYLLDEISDEQWTAKAAKGKTVQGCFTHINNVRLMWLKVWDAMGDLEKLDDKTATREQTKAALEASAKAMETAIDEFMNKGTRPKSFKPSTEAFVGYITAHEANHRAQVDFILRLVGNPISDAVHYGMWEWGIR